MKFRFAALLFALSLSAFSQHFERMNYALAQKLAQGNPSDVVSILVKGEVTRVSQLVLRAGGRFKYSAGTISAVTLPLGKIGLLVNAPVVEYMELACVHLRTFNDSMEVNNKLVPVHAGMAPLPQAYDGSGVVVGIIDTGIDYSHPDFKDSLGKSRIRFLWDQNLPLAPNTPQPYNYGQHWNNLQIDSGQASAHSDAPHTGHGTHVSGVAAGNGLALNKYAGVAPRADLIVVAAILNDTTGTSIPDAVNYIFTKAALLGEPCVINISLGDYFGSHDGLDLQAQVMANMVTAQPGRVIVAAGGNAGNYPLHLGYTVTSDTSFTWFDYYPSQGRVSIQVWADTADLRYVNFAIGADQVSPSYSFRGRTAFTAVFPHLSVFNYDTVWNNSNRIGVVRYFASQSNGRYALNIDIFPDSSAYEWRLMATGSGKFDTWNYDVSGANLADSTVFPDLANYKLPDVKQTIATSFQCSPEVITVGNYVNRNQYIDYDTVLYTVPVVPGSLSYNSSKGPSRTGLVKPDITASGDYTLAPVVLSLVPLYVANNLSYKLAMGGYHFRDGGTSTASPVVAGIAALYLQRYPNATNQDVKNAIIMCPYYDSFTGMNLPDDNWGYGKVNAFTALTNCLTTDHTTAHAPSSAFTLFPNPANTTITVRTGAGGGVLVICNVVGEEVERILLEDSGELTIDISGLAPGAYFCTLHNGDSGPRNRIFVKY
jgi:subtilisin family serine protease